MFAVPGWAVSASTLVQDKPRPKKSSAKDADKQDSQRIKKRKRNHEPLEDEAGTTIASASPHATSGPTALEMKATKKLKHDKNERRERDFEVNNGDGRDAPADVVPDPLPRDRTKHKVTPGSRRQKGDRGSEEAVVPDKRKRMFTSTDGATTLASPGPVSTAKLTPLQAKMRSKLTSARFRHLNETLYTTSSSDAFKLFSTSPELFSDYHAGFAQQVKDSWPQNPVEDYVKSVKTRGAIQESARGMLPLPRRKTGSCTIADLGCGDAPLARGCQAVIRSLKLKFHNYDLHAANTMITKADIADLPLRDGEADIAVFCLSLMGTNWISFVEEAWRILRGDGKGEVWVAEVKSRFGRVLKGRVVENSVGKRRKQPKSNNNGDGYDGTEQFAEVDGMREETADETDITGFIKVFTRRGFQLREGSVNKRNKMFVSMIFTKSGIPTAGKHKGMKWTGREYQKQPEGKPRYTSGQKDDEELSVEQEAKVLKPCVYKIR